MSLIMLVWASIQIFFWAAVILAVLFVIAFLSRLVGYAIQLFFGINPKF